ncbi:MAG: ROK family protein [Verrucomicrobiota bacterium]
MRYVIGIDLGGTNIKAIAVKESGELIREFSHPTRDGEFQGEIPQFAIEIRELMGEIEAELGEALSVGISAPGLATKDARAIYFIPGKMQGLPNFDWVDFLGRATPVVVWNDAHAALQGEAWVGAAAGKSDVLMFTIGTGIGGAIMCDGKLLKGHIGRAGHMGHVCIDSTRPGDDWNIPGSLEMSISEVFIKNLNHAKYQTTKALVDGYRTGAPEAVQLWTEAVRKFAVGVASMINTLDPELVIIGGGGAKAGDSLLQPFRQFMDEYEMRPDGHQVEIAVAQLDSNAGAFGVAKAALDALD